MAEFNKEILEQLLGNSNTKGYNSLPLFAQLSGYVEILEKAWTQINKTGMDELKKEETLRKIMLAREEKFNTLSYKQKQEILKQQEKARKEEQKRIDALKEVSAQLEGAAKLKLDNTIKEREKQLADSKARGTTEKEKQSELAKLRAEGKKNTEYYIRIQKELKEQRAERIKEQNKEAFWKQLGVERTDSEGNVKKLSESIGDAISNGISKLAQVADKWFKTAEDTLTQYNAKITARLEGSGKEYTDLSKTIRQNLSTSTIVKQTDVLTNLAKLVDSGIAYNLEQRAFLATVRDDIASTFDVFNGNLAQIIRLQRQDSTYARMGLEASLQSFFNENFLDTAYLSTLREGVSGALIDAEATMTNEMAVAFEYNVQKWLGSLYSMGASSNLVNQIASGLNMLATGNVSGLSGSPIQSLLALAANRSGTSYSDLLSKGLDASNVNDLLKSMVEYLSEIATSTKDNRILSGAYNTIFNMSQADLRAIRNVSNDISTIYNNTLTYQQAQNATTGRLGNIAERIPLAARVKNLLENLSFSAAANIIENPALYTVLLATNALEDITGGLTMELAPFGAGVSFKMTELIKDGLFGISFLSEAIRGLGNLNSGNVPYEWLNTTPGQMRGTGYSLSASSGTSVSYTAGGSSSDIEQQNLQAGANKQKEVKEGLNSEESDAVTMEDLFYGLFNDKSESGQLSALTTNSYLLLEMLSNSYLSDLNAQRVVVTGFNFGSGADTIELPIKFGSSGYAQLANASGTAAKSITGAGDMTLAQLIALLQSVLTTEQDAVNINMKYSEVDLQEFISGSAAPGSSNNGPGSNIVSQPAGNNKVFYSMK